DAIAARGCSIASALAGGDPTGDFDAGASNRSQLLRLEIGEVLLEEHLHRAVLTLSSCCLDLPFTGIVRAGRTGLADEIFGPPAPEACEQRVEQLAPIRAPQEHRTQGEVEVDAVSDVDRAHRSQGVVHFGRADREL